MIRPRLSGRQCRNWIIFCCLLTVVAACGIGASGLTTAAGNFPAASSQNRSAARQLPVQPILPKGYGVQDDGRDLFAVPPEFQPASATAKPVTPAPNNSKDAAGPVSTIEKNPTNRLVLVGIISGGGQGVAIVKNAAGSRSYRINDYIENYQLIAVAENSVTLRGPQGQKVLALER